MGAPADEKKGNIAHLFLPSLKGCGGFPRQNHTVLLQVACSAILPPLPGPVSSLLPLVPLALGVVTALLPPAPGYLASSLVSPLSLPHSFVIKPLVQKPSSNDPTFCVPFDAVGIHANTQSFPRASGSPVESASKDTGGRGQGLAGVPFLTSSGGPCGSSSTQRLACELQ